jgi:tetratricopeptide (TPR) repeat protein
VLEANGRREVALRAFRRASELAPQSASFAYNLGRALSNAGDNDASLKELERALQFDAGHRAASALRAEVLRRLGRIDDAIEQYRELLRRQPADVRVWSAMAALNRDCFDDGDLAAMQRIESAPGLGIEEKVRIAFALARAFAAHGRYAEAFASCVRANSLARSKLPWNANAFSAQVDAVLAAFAMPIVQPQTQLGSEMIFIVSLPRSGSTLTEQILAAHAQVDAGDERMDLFNVIAAEGQRRKLPLARWAPGATVADWQRLGHAYLERSRHWRGSAARATDKLPANWLWLGAALAMLPGARVIDCRRDLLETAWSCFSHLFAGGAQEFSYDFDSIAAYARDYERAMTQWQAQYPQRIRTQSYEALLADPETQTRELLAFCGLDFDPACLNFHEARRSVRTASAAQVREPLRRDTARTARYGTLLDPLRKALGLPAFRPE